MGKKKNKDFNKVKLKLGKVLKKQNETIVDLTKKKIYLPKEKEHAPKTAENRDNFSILNEHIHRLQTANDEVQRKALISVQSILYPFASQLAVNMTDYANGISREPPFKLLENLFGTNINNSDFNFQVGDLLHGLNRLSQNSQNAKLPLETAKLCKTLITIFSCHHRMHTVLVCIDRIASSLLRRPESWWRLGGIKILSNISDARKNIMLSLASSSEPFILHVELQALTDINYQLYRSQTYPRLLVRHFDSLNEATTIDVARSRLSLLTATMSFLQDCQYSQYITPLSFANSTNELKFHPFLASTKVNLSDAAECSWQESEYPNIVSQCTWMLLDSELVGAQAASSSFPADVNSVPANVVKRAKKSQCESTRSTEECAAAWTDRKLAICIINEGLRLLDELVHQPKTETVLGLIYVLRSLRVFAETKGAAFFLPKFPEQPNLPDVSRLLCRFCSRLNELIPLNMPDGELLPQEASVKSSASTTTNLEFLLTASANLSRKDQKKMQKRAAKTARRKNYAETTPMDTNAVKGKEIPMHLYKKRSLSEVLSHLLKQAIVQLYFAFNLLDCSYSSFGGRKLSNRDHNPLKISNGVLRELAAFLLSKEEEADDDVTNGKTGDMKPEYRVRPLAALSDRIPALAWRWLRVFDHCLLYHLRLSARRPISSKAKRQSIDFIAPMLIVVFKDFHGWCLRHCSSAATTSFSRVPRSIVRAAGILTAFFVQELYEASWIGWSRSLSSAEAGIQYDSSWIADSLDRLDQRESTANKILTTFVTDLRLVISAHVDNSTLSADATDLLSSLSSTSNWLWAALCLANLIDHGCSDAALAISGDNHEASVLRQWIHFVGGLSATSKLSNEGSLIFLPSPATGRYSTLKAWRCTPIANIVAQETGE